MAFSPDVDWTSTFRELPTPTGARSSGDDEFRDTKTAFRERFARDHNMVLGSDNDLHGIHRAGTGRSSVQHTDPALNAAEEAIAGLGGYLNTERQDDRIDMFQVRSFSGSAWAGVAASIPSDHLDALPTSTFLVDSGVNVHASTIISWVRTYLGGDYHGFVPALGTIGGRPVHGIRYVTTSQIIINTLFGTVTWADSNPTHNPVALLMMDAR